MKEYVHISLSSKLKENPSAVFIRKTHLTTMDDWEGFNNSGYLIAKELFQTCSSKSEVLATSATRSKLILKPNVVHYVPEDADGNPMTDVRGMVTNVHFVAGIIDYLQELGAKDLVIAEGGGPIDMMSVYEDWGYVKMAEKRGIPLLNLNKLNYGDDDLNWVTVEDGVVMKDIPFVRPILDENTRFINIPTLKTHNLGLTTLCCKNLQGVVAHGYKHYCNAFDSIANYPPEKLKHFQPNYKEAVLESWKRHLKENWPRWDMGNKRDEVWAQRICDTLMAIKPWVNIIEGIIGRDGTAFRHGTDHLGNLIIAGVHPVHVDAIATYLMGHNPQRINYLMLAHERGLGQINPQKIDVYLLQDDGTAIKCVDLDKIGRLRLGVYHHGDTSKYVFF